MKVGIIGLGLMGGSLGLCLKENKLISSVYGLDLDAQNAKDALKLGLIHELIGFDKLSNCDIIFIATPVNAIIEILQNLKELPKTTTIIELGSTKRKIVESLPATLIKQTIFAHPMAGTENSGPKAAFEELYKDAVCVLCDSEVADDLHQKRAVEIFSHLGMRIVFMDSTSHDHHTAIISHLPHAISFSLANYVMREEDRRNIAYLGGPSFKGMCRIAKSSPLMWGGIFTQNKENILASIEHFQEELENCKKMLKNCDENKLKKWMEKANHLREIL
ncbi:prephenate dehydrogenase [Campylobacter upsaliensis]|uniref:Prephenate dehydrogenase n=1 Tax=Campylobacter upsaliensis JV21 TaxID=888826 RepID=A0A828QVV8_CAMUP|nr:prephenate dehydrogenase [Campylobacter upsaliensis]EAH4719949.1 prephenate dehydrogenase [Campylobacter upsaliensis]EAH8309283.1 prephenate dehydrogenase [Campylobacter upsaliensis]EAK0458414.1 prephenate dehydrogenase [Campylobacter upsaliensis]EDP6869928.1 prephenate dehydrogenase [Campylobacter upsaliensis]EFM2941318.1 prephenate dehydrogenase [Campylobacter upsaliensis]